MLSQPNQPMQPNPNLVQPYGCLIAVDPRTLTVTAFSENAPDTLDLTPRSVPTIAQTEPLSLGSNALSLFLPRTAAALRKAAAFDDVTLLNPVLLQTKNSNKLFYSVLHRNEESLLVEIEPVGPSDQPFTAAGALTSYKLAAKAIGRIQALPSGNLSLLCDVLVRELKELAGYDRVLIYPSTDIPDSLKFDFTKNRVSMICDVSADPVRVIQDENLTKPISLSRSTLRACEGCYAEYMKSVGARASLVMPVELTGDEERRAGGELWGMVVCLHASPRFLPFPVRYACEFLMRAVAVQIKREVELAAQIKEKRMLKMQTVLCEMLLRESLVRIFSDSPNVMDLVKCDGAALYYRDKFWLLGVTPGEEQVKDICMWLVGCLKSTSGMVTDSLSEAGYPGASSLGEDVCGMAAIRITGNDFILWFRSQVADEDGSKGGKANSQFLGDFMELHKKQRSSPWEDVEMNAIHSLQIIVRSSLKEEGESEAGSLVLQGTGELRSATVEIMRLLETASAPVVAVDFSGKVNGWNAKTEELTGLSMEKAVGMPLVDLIEKDSAEVVKKMLNLAFQDKEERDVEMILKSFRSTKNGTGSIVLRANACCIHDRKGNVVGACLVAQDITEEKLILEKYARIQGDYFVVNRNPNTFMPPIFIANALGICVEWNAPMEKLTGLRREEALDKILAGEVFTVHSFGCRIKGDTLTKLRIVLNGLMIGFDDSQKLQFSFFDVTGGYVEVILSASKRVDAEGKVHGVVCFLQAASLGIEQALLQRRKAREENCTEGLAYIRREVRNPIQGLILTHRLMAVSDLTEEQRRLLRLAALCREQLAKIANEDDLESIEQCYIEMSDKEFNIGESMEAVMSQGMSLSKAKGVPLVLKVSVEVYRMKLLGDNLRLQQILSNFLVNSLHFTLPSKGPILLSVTPRIERIAMSVQIARFEFRVTHPAPGIPDALIREIFQPKREPSREGLSMYINQKLVKIMGGTVQYLREATSSSFIILLEFPVAEI